MKPTIHATCAFVIAAVTAVALAVIPAADAHTSLRVVKTFRLPTGGYDMAAGLGAMWIVRDDEFNDTLVYRVNPLSDRIRRVAHLHVPGGGLAVGDGSLWVSDYFGDAVYRVSASGRVLARIPTGLQPERIHLGLGSVWVANHHGHSVTRIDPATNRVIATESAGAKQFRDGPQDITDDGHLLYVGSSNRQKLQQINPITNTTLTPPGSKLPDAFCGKLDYSSGWVWSDDLNCTDSVYRLGRDGHIVQTIDYGHSSEGDIGSMATRGHTVWVCQDGRFDPNTGTGGNAALYAYDASSGTRLRSEHLGGDCSALAAGFGDLWAFNFNTATVRRVKVP